MLISIFLLLASLTKAQRVNDFGGGDTRKLSIRGSNTNSTDDIADHVKSTFTTDQDKVMAIYEWVTTNIRYDKDSANQINLGVDPDAKVTVAFRRRRGVCENFAAIFNDICVKSGLTSFVVNGYTKESGNVDKTGHSWAAVMVNKDWYLFDPTWDAGYNMRYSFFMVSPGEFINTHMPYDPLWQLLNYPITPEQFLTGNLYKKRDAPYFNYVDSIVAYIKMDSLQKFQSSAKRIERNKPDNTLLKNNYNYLKMHIEMINQDKDVDLYNSSVAELNGATDIYNHFIEYRNKMFIPEKPDDDLKAMLDGVDIKLKDAVTKLDEIDKSSATFKIGTDGVRTRIAAMFTKISDQRMFLQRYLSLAKTNRNTLFYK